MRYVILFSIILSFVIGCKTTENTGSTVKEDSSGLNEEASTAASAVRTINELLPEGIILPGECQLAVEIFGINYGFILSQGDKKVHMLIANEGKIETSLLANNQSRITYEAKLKNNGELIPVPFASKTYYYLEVTKDEASGDIISLTATEDLSSLPFLGRTTIKCQ